MDIILFIVGIFLLWRGEMKISKNKVLKGKKARIIGLIALVPAVVSFGLGFMGFYQNGISGIIVWSIIFIVLVGILTLSEKVQYN